MSSASMCSEPVCEVRVLLGSTGAGASGRRTRERVQKGTKEAYEPTSETTAYSWRRVYLNEYLSSPTWDKGVPVLRTYGRTFCS